MKVNEIFYSIQGEGQWAGTPASFIRLSGCNLNCPFCDTQHEQFDHQPISRIISQINKHPNAQLKSPYKHVIITGGEPYIHSLTPELIYILKQAGWFVHVESNGTKSLTLQPEYMPHWMTLSPKLGSRCPYVTVAGANELKFLMDWEGSAPGWTGKSIQAFLNDHCIIPNGQQNPHLFIQPIWADDDPELCQHNMDFCAEWVKKNPQFRLSLQVHKLLDIP